MYGQLGSSQYCTCQRCPYCGKLVQNGPNAYAQTLGLQAYGQLQGQPYFGAWQGNIGQQNAPQTAQEAPTEAS